MCFTTSHAQDDPHIIDTSTTTLAPSGGNEKLDAILFMLMNIKEDVRSLKLTTRSLQETTDTLQAETKQLQSKRFLILFYNNRNQ